MIGISSVYIHTYIYTVYIQCVVCDNTCHQQLTEVKLCVPCYIYGKGQTCESFESVVSLHKSISVEGKEVVLRPKAGYSYAKRIQSESHGCS